MSQTPTLPGAAAQEPPLNNFSNCHAGIIARLRTFGELPGLLEPAARARKIARETLDFFRDVVQEHHAEEERELFPAVLASAIRGEERDRIQVMVDQLTAEHRTVEGAWKKLEPDLKKVARGQDGDVNVAGIGHLVASYLAHAAFEETQFLPLAHTILSRNGNHMDALGLSLHLRHAPQVVAHV